jgi:MFS family permease
VDTTLRPPEPLAAAGRRLTLPPEPASELLLAATVATSLAALLAWFGPPGTDLAAHVYQRAVFLEHGFELWNNFWYAGRYSFVTYSVLYYPLAALLGIRLLAVLTIAVAAVAFAAVVRREWGPAARWSGRAFAVVWTGMVVSAAFPFVLGSAFALLALWALQAGRRWSFACLTALALASSPLAFLLLVLLLGAVALSRRGIRLMPVAIVAGAGAVWLFVWRLFPTDGRYPFPAATLAAACAFCVLGAAFTWRVERARLLHSIFLVYLAANIVSYAVPSTVGENIARLRFAAIPLAVLALSLRSWRPRPLAVLALALATSWNLTPLAASFVRESRDPTVSASYWQPAIDFLRRNLTPSYRVEVVDTAGHWAARYLPGAGIPLARGWFRQDDFPANEVLYDRFGRDAYLGWLRSLAIRYVVLTDATADYSAQAEAALLRSGHSGLRRVFRSAHLTIFEVPSPQALVTGPGRSSVTRLTQREISIVVQRPGSYRVAVRYSPYWRPSQGCVKKGRDEMLRLVASRAGPVLLRFDFQEGRLLGPFGGSETAVCP